MLVSALGWRGAPHRLYRRCRSGGLSLVTSPQLIGELTRVLHYPKFDFSGEEIERFLADVRDHAEIVHSDIELAVIGDDPADNRVLECAIAGDADWIVSGDEHLLALGSYEGLRIGTAREFLIWLDR